MTAPSLDAIFAITPELCLILLAVIVLLYDRALKPSEHRNPALITAWGTLVIIIITLGIWLIYDQPSNTPTQYWGGMISQDMYTMIFRLVFLLALLLTALISIDVGKLQRGEYFALLISATIGFSLMAASTDLMMLYVALETAGISLYVLAGFTKGVYRSSEAGMKYFIYGAFATAVMLYGMSLLYGASGSLDLTEIGAAFSNDATLHTVIPLATLLTLAGLGFKASLAPFDENCQTTNIVFQILSHSDDPSTLFQNRWFDRARPTIASSILKMFSRVGLGCDIVPSNPDNR